MKLFFLTLILFVSTERNYLTGRVTNESGQNLYGIKITWLNKVAYTDFDGSFKIQVPKDNQVQIDFSLNKTKLKTIYTCTDTPKRDLGVIILK